MAGHFTGSRVKSGMTIGRKANTPTTRSPRDLAMTLSNIGGWDDTEGGRDKGGGWGDKERREIAQPPDTFSR